MTRKDYILIAGAIKEVYEYQKYSDGEGSKSIKQAALRVVARTIADVMQYENQRFDKIRFLTACGLEAENISM